MTHTHTQSINHLMTEIFDKMYILFIFEDLISITACQFNDRITMIHFQKQQQQQRQQSTRVLFWYVGAQIIIPKIQS